MRIENSDGDIFELKEAVQVGDDNAFHDKETCSHSLLRYFFWVRVDE
jgi:hypothetical protein